LIILLLVPFCLTEKANRAKRFAGFSSLSTVGGRVGCVVSKDNKLFVNGRFTKDLSESEQEELEEYKSKLDQFKSSVKTYLEERQKLFRQNALTSRNHGAENAVGDANQTSEQSKKPEPPKKPSFCSDKATTQYVFDGCSVQGDTVYIGDTLVRKLTPPEMEELQRFDKQFTEYQRAVTGQFRQQVEEIFGKHFGQIFGGSSSQTNSAGSNEVSAPAAQRPQQPSETTPTALEAPKTPNFCTLIV